MNPWAALLLLFVVQSPQDDYEKWEREKVTPTKERIEAALKSDAKRQWWEGRYFRERDWIHGYDELILFGGEFYEKVAKVTGGIGKVEFKEGKLTITHQFWSNEYPGLKETYVPVRWGKQVLLFDGSEYEFLDFCNRFNSGESLGIHMSGVYSTSLSDWSFAEIPELPKPYREKLLLVPREYQISEIIEPLGSYTVPILHRSIKGSKVKVKFNEENTPYLAMEVYADQARFRARGYVLAIGDGECEIAIERDPYNLDRKIGETLTTKAPPSLLNDGVWWQPAGDHAMAIRFLPSFEDAMKPEAKEPAIDTVLKWLNDDLRWVAAHAILVGRYSSDTKLHCDEVGDHFELDYAGLTLTLPKRPKDAEKNWIPEPDYGDAKAQQKNLQQFWKSKLEDAKK